MIIKLRQIGVAEAYQKAGFGGMLYILNADTMLGGLEHTSR
jgi:hypothetical protein